MSKVSLRHLDAPCILYNLNGYYDGLSPACPDDRKGLSSRNAMRICFCEDLEKSGGEIGVLKILFRVVLVNQHACPG